MPSLFQGAPQTATSYTTSSTETPKWMQDAIYNQIQLATNIANTSYQPYNLPTVAQLSPLQQQAYQQVQNNQGAWQPAMTQVQGGLSALAGSNAGAAAAQPYFGQATGMATAAGNTGTADQLQAEQAKYLHPELAGQNLAAGQSSWGKAAGLDSVGAAQPLIGASAAGTQAAMGGSALSAANPLLTAASQKSTTGIQDYMNPYQQGVLDLIAKQGGRNLNENILPNVSDAFVRSGSFGGTRMGEFGERAVRDTQEAILNQQAQAAQAGYGQALTASNADLSRQGQLASTTGQLATSDLGRQLSGAQQLGTLGALQGQLTGQQQQNLTSLGSAQTGAGQQQQQFGLSAAEQAQQAQQADLARQLQASQQIGSFGAQAGSLAGSDATRQLGALGQLSSAAQQAQGLRAGDAAALESAGLAQQHQQQQQLDAAQQQYLQEQAYPKTQADWLNAQIRGIAPTVPTATTQSGTQTGGTYSASPLSQLATGLYTYKGLTS